MNGFLGDNPALLIASRNLLVTSFTEELCGHTLWHHKLPQNQLQLLNDLEGEVKEEHDTVMQDEQNISIMGPHGLDMGTIYLFVQFI